MTDGAFGLAAAVLRQAALDWMAGGDLREDVEAFLAGDEGEFYCALVGLDPGRLLLRLQTLGGKRPLAMLRALKIAS